MTKREQAIHQARMAGFHFDTAQFTRLIVESRVNRGRLNNAWLEGVAYKTAGMKCTCYACSKVAQ